MYLSALNPKCEIARPTCILCRAAIAYEKKETLNFYTRTRIQIYRLNFSRSLIFGFFCHRQKKRE